MKVTVQDAAVLRELKPLEVVAYLRAKGWRQEADLAGKGSLWILNSDFDVTVPARRDLGDYILRMAEVLHTLAKAEDRSELEVLRDVQTAIADLIRIRALGRNADSGTLALDQAVTFVEKSRDLMLAAACAAIDKRPVFAKRKAQQAMDYLTHVRMGQTEQGSYVLNILSPVAPELLPASGVPSPSELQDPYERKVTLTLIDSLSALDEAARQAVVLGNMTPFQAAVPRGVSANLCDAVLGLAAVSPGEGLDIQASWSRTRPVDAHTKMRVFLSSDAMPIIEEAARQFRETARSEDVEVVGLVTRLDRAPYAREGEVTILGDVEGQMRRVMLRLGEEMYSQAVQAHEGRHMVKCTGDLVKEGRGYRLYDPRHFRLVNAEEVE
jgi:hypothetical protein